jgi:D-tyrosyl-tRNA(Tyr) deacylase
MQRVSSASVHVNGVVVASIGRGLMCLCGITTSDKPADSDWLSSKILSTRLWTSSNGKLWHESVKSQDLEVLLVSQFTLHGVLKGNRPDFHHSMGSTEAEVYFNSFVESVGKKHPNGKTKVKSGVFGAMMQVEIVNDGPVTLILDSDEAGFKKTKKHQRIVSTANEEGGNGGSSGGMSKKQAKREQRKLEKLAKEKAYKAAAAAAAKGKAANGVVVGEEKQTRVSCDATVVLNGEQLANTSN